MEIFGIHICPHCVMQAIVIIKDDFALVCKQCVALLKRNPVC
jgi:hypothetical protein